MLEAPRRAHAATEIFVSGFLQRGVNVRLLARNAQAAAAHYPQAQVIQGSLMNPRDVARVCEGVDAAFAVTPMGLRDNPALEIKAGQSIAEGAKSNARAMSPHRTPPPPRAPPPPILR